MIKKIAAVGVLTLTLTGCVSPITEAKVFVAKPVINVIHNNFDMKSIMKNAELLANTKKISNALSKLDKTVGKTWYVFSGATPSGWDCSGLTLWFYEQMGISLKHRASEQQYAGVRTKDPKPGNIVVFKYKGYKAAYHVGIYIGNGLMIHAPKLGHLTRVENISTFAGKYSTIEYREILKSL
jgi:cell wall-associated NlpC family hydrolase